MSPGRSLASHGNPQVGSSARASGLGTLLGVTGGVGESPAQPGMHRSTPDASLTFQVVASARLLLYWGLPARQLAI